MVYDLLNAQDVSKIFKCSRALVYRMAERGQLPCVRWDCPGGGENQKTLVRFKKQDVIKFVEKHYRK